MAEVDADDIKRIPQLVWLPNQDGALTTLFRGSVLTVERRGPTQWPWAATIAGTVVSEGISPSQEHAMVSAIEGATDAASASADS